VNPDTRQDQTETVYSRPFNGTPKLYRRVAVAAGLYLGLGVYLVYALIRYYFAGDGSVFGLEALSCVGLFLLLYIPWSYRMMLRYDGLLSSGSSWRYREARVKLAERKEHRRFG
jgi:hypothetical protein